MSTPESAVLRSCLDYLALCGIAAWRINTMGTPLAHAPGKFRPAPAKGIADIIGIVTVRGDGMQALPLAVECKSATGRQSPAQREFQAKWEQAGGLYLLVRSVEELREALRDAGVRVK
jgi:hypothetical protein